MEPELLLKPLLLVFLVWLSSVTGYDSTNKHQEFRSNQTKRYGCSIYKRRSSNMSKYYSLHLTTGFTLLVSSDFFFQYLLKYFKWLIRNLSSPRSVSISFKTINIHFYPIIMQTKRWELFWFWKYSPTFQLVKFTN